MKSKILKTVLQNLLIAFAICTSTWSFGQVFPNKPIEWVVPYPPGGGTDIVARTLAEAIQKTLGQSIVINNKPGAATIIGAEYTAKAKADGYTILSADTATLAANPFLYSKLPYNPEKDFSAIGLMCRFNLILVVNPNVPANNLKEFLAWVKAQPNSVNFASPGAGSPHHLATELFKTQTKINLTHVPYKGLAPALQDVLGGQVPFMFVDSAAGLSHINAGKLKPIAVANLKRLNILPNVPTFNESGLKKFEAYAWQGLVAPFGTPVAEINLLNEELRKALNNPAIQDKFTTLGLEITASSPAEMNAYAKQERSKWSKLIQTNHIQLD